LALEVVRRRGRGSGGGVFRLQSRGGRHGKKVSVTVYFTRKRQDEGGMEKNARGIAGRREEREAI